jgi:hypothetical protein
VSGGNTWPQVFEGGRLIGDAEAVAAHFGPLPVVDNSGATTATAETAAGTAA